MPTGPAYVTPHIQFLFVAPPLLIGVTAPFGRSRVSLVVSAALRLLQTPPHDDALALLLTFGSANTWQEDLHLSSLVPCPAHAFALNRLLCDELRLRCNKTLDLQLLAALLSIPKVILALLVEPAL